MAENAAPGATRQFAGFAAGLNYASLPPEVREALTVFLLDYLRVASLGQRMPWSAWATRLARELGGNGHATLLFGEDRSDPERATFVNATYSGSIDADDVHVGSMLHPGCVVISAALAIGEARNQPGERILAAIAAGYENHDPHRALHPAIAFSSRLPEHGDLRRLRRGNRCGLPAVHGR